MPKNETPLQAEPQPRLNADAYAELYPSLPGRLKAVLQSTDPALRAKAAGLAVMAGRRGRAREARLREDYRLTPAEARLAAHIGDGGTIANYAALNGVAEGTVRTHLKAVFAKTGVHRQSDLARLLAAGDR